MASQFKDIRKDLEQDEMVASMMAGLRGTHMDNSNFADEGNLFTKPAEVFQELFRRVHAVSRGRREQRSKRQTATRLQTRSDRCLLV